MDRKRKEITVVSNADIKKKGIKNVTYIAKIVDNGIVKYTARIGASDVVLTSENTYNAFIDAVKPKLTVTERTYTDRKGNTHECIYHSYMEPWVLPVDEEVRIDDVAVTPKVVVTPVVRATKTPVKTSATPKKRGRPRKNAK